MKKRMSLFLCGKSTFPQSVTLDFLSLLCFLKNPHVVWSTWFLGIPTSLDGTSGPLAFFRCLKNIMSPHLPSLQAFAHASFSSWNALLSLFPFPTFIAQVNSSSSIIFPALFMCHIFYWGKSHCPQQLSVWDLISVLDTPASTARDASTSTAELWSQSYICICIYLIIWGFCSGSVIKNLFQEQGPQESWVQSLTWEDPLEEGTATHSRILAWRIPWTEEPGRLGSQRVRHNWSDLAHTHEQAIIWLMSLLP